MQRRHATLSTLAFAALAVASPAQAQVWNNGTPDGLNGNEMTQWIQAEDFTLGGATTVTGFDFWAFYYPGYGGSGYDGSIFWQILSNNGGVPNAGSVLASGTATGRTSYGTVGSYDMWLHDVNGLSLNLGAGTYWLALHNGPLSTTTRDDYYWATSAQSGNGSEDGAPFDNVWYSNGTEHAFQVFAGQAPQTTVPEPVSVILLGTGLLGIGIVRRRRSVKDALENAA